MSLTEGEIIEMAARRRKLEDLCEYAEKWLPAEANQLNYDQFATRDAIEAALEACRDDSVRMEEALRAAGGIR